MLQPPGYHIVSGLTFSTLVSLLLVPIVYRIFGRADPLAIAAARPEVIPTGRSHRTATND